MDQVIPDDFWYGQQPSLDPFPSVDLASMPVFARTAMVAEISSSVLRDSDLVRNSTLKALLLSDVLKSWGQLVVALETDERFGDTILAAIREALIESDGEFSEHPGITDLFAESWSLMSALGGMAYSLQSQKLSPSLDDCFERREFTDDAQRVVMGSLLDILNGGEGWARHLPVLSKVHGRIPAVGAIYWIFGQTAWASLQLSVPDETALLDFLVSESLLQSDIPSEADRRRQRGATEGKFRHARLVHSRNLLPPGEALLDGEAVSDGDGDSASE